MFLGWYFDIDTIHMKNLDYFRNRSLFSTDDYLIEDEGRTHGSLADELGYSISNGAFHIVKNESQFLWSIMNYFQKHYSSKLWSSGGSDIVTKAFKEACLIESHEYGYFQKTGTLTFDYLVYYPIFQLLMNFLHRKFLNPSLLVETRRNFLTPLPLDHYT